MSKQVSAIFVSLFQPSEICSNSRLSSFSLASTSIGKVKNLPVASVCSIPSFPFLFHLSLSLSISLSPVTFFLLFPLPSRWYWYCTSRDATAGISRTRGFVSNAARTLITPTSGKRAWENRQLNGDRDFSARFSVFQPPWNRCLQKRIL